MYQKYKYILFQFYKNNVVTFVDIQIYFFQFYKKSSWESTPLSISIFTALQ